MAYQLICPECPHRTDAAFVRIGAMVRCAGCGHVYRVQESHVMRSIAPEAKPEYVQAIHKQAEAQAEDSSPSLSGLSELMQREAMGSKRRKRPARPKAGGESAAAASQAQAAPSAGPAGPTSPPSAGGGEPRDDGPPPPSAIRIESAMPVRKIRAAARRRRLVPMATAVGTAVLAVALVTLLWLVPSFREAPTSEPSQPGATIQAAGPGTDPEGTPVAIADRRLRLRFAPLYEATWRVFPEPEPMPTVEPGAIRVDSATQRFSPEAGVQISVALANDTDRLATRTDVVVALVQPERDELIAIRRATAVGLEPGVGRVMTMPMPREFMLQRPRVEAWVDQVHAQTGSWQTVEADVLHDLEDASWEAYFAYDGPRTVRAGLVAYERLDEQGHLQAGHWATWIQPIDASPKIQIEPEPAFDGLGLLDDVRVRVVLMWDPGAIPPLPAPEPNPAGG